MTRPLLFLALLLVGCERAFDDGPLCRKQIIDDVRCVICGQRAVGGGLIPNSVSCDWSRP